MMRVISSLLLAGVLACRLNATDVEAGIKAYTDGRYSEARRLLDGAHDERGQAFLALAQAASGECAQALPVLLRKPADLQLHKFVGTAAVSCYLTAGDVAHATALVSDLQDLFPTDPDVLYAVAKTHMKGFNEATLALYQRAPASWRVHQLSAEIFEVEGRWNEAAAEYRKAIALNDRAVDLHFRLGRALLFQSHDPKALDEAQAAFEAEHALRPEDGVCIYQLGQIALVRGEQVKAKTLFQQALALDPAFTSDAVALGKLLLAEHQYPDAIRTLEQATKLDEKNESAHYALMTAYRNAGRMDDARREKAILDQLQKPASGAFSDFLKKLGEKTPQPQ